jgi:hypothetical protein
MPSSGSEFLKQAGESKHSSRLSVATFALNLHLKAGLRFCHTPLIGQAYSRLCQKTCHCLPEVKLDRPPAQADADQNGCPIQEMVESAVC